MDQGLDEQASGIEAIPSVVNNEEINEKLIPQSAVDKAIKHAKYLAREQGKKEALMELQSQNQQPSDNNVPVVNQQPQQPQSLGGMPSLSAEQVKQMIADHLQKQAEDAHQQVQQQHAHSIANEFLGKIATGKDKYPDFDETIDALELATIPQVVQLANSFDNTADIVYELGKNPNKVANLLGLSQLGNGKLAYLETKKLSDSIKQNQGALQRPVPPEPLSQLKPSNVGTDNGALSVSELRKQSYLRS